MNADKPILSPRRIVQPLSPLNFSDQQKNNSSPRKFFDTINFTGRRGQDSNIQKTPDLSVLNEESQDLLIHAVDTINHRNSEQIVNVLDESRHILRSSLEEFKREQNACRQELETILRSKQPNRRRKAENIIPLSIYLQQKRTGDETPSDFRSDSQSNQSYEIYFESLLSTNNGSDCQHPSDRAAVIKYLRKRERRKRAEEYRKSYQLTNDALEKQTAVIIEKMEGMDMKLERERQRQTDLFRSKIQKKIVQRKNQIEAHEIIDQASEANLARQRVEEMHRGKIEARLSAARSRQPSTHPIHVQSLVNDEDDLTWNEQQIQTSKLSLQLLAEDNDQRPRTNKSSDLSNDETLTKIDV